MFHLSSFLPLVPPIILIPLVVKSNTVWDFYEAIFGIRNQIADRIHGKCSVTLLWCSSHKYKCVKEYLLGMHQTPVS